MRTSQEILASLAKSFALTLLLWVVFSWPLPVHVTTAIPAGTVKPMQGTSIQPLHPGDHLQLDYHFWIFGDMLAGKTPWMVNLYEFNTGNDAERREPGTYYLPFSFFYTVGSWISGRAFGWNLTGFLSLWLTAWFTWLLACRYTPREAAWLAAAAAIMLPYRWINVAGGSPTGFAMAWVPLLLLGLDIAVRENRVRGGFVAGLALVFAAWGDTHTFFFGALATPCWCLFAFLHRKEFAWKDWRAFARLTAALAPVVIITALAHWSSPTAARHISEAGSKVRRMSEVALYSPYAEGFFSWDTHPISDHVFVGYAVVAILVAGLAMRLRRKQPVLGIVLLALGAAIVAVLALGPRGPFDGGFFAAARKVIGPYGMIRQPAKVYCLMPTVLALIAALCVAPYRRPGLAAAVGGILLFAEWRWQIQPVLSRFESTQGAYAAAAQTGPQARALALPLWPGDSHQSSAYQHFSSLYRLRMVNGYRPFVSKDYIDNIFHRFESVNQGWLSNEQADDLLQRGVTTLLLHEDLFPEKVSPFPVGHTLKQLLNHPRLRFLDRDGAVWAFQIMKEAAPKDAMGTNWTFYFPSRKLEMELGRISGTKPAGDKYASRGGYVELHKPGAKVETRQTYGVPAPDLRWLVRMRGQGSVRSTARIGDRNAELDVNVQALEWAWHEVPFPAPEGYEALSLTLEYAGGEVDADTAILVAGDWHPLQPGDTLAIPAPCFFHAGHTRIESNTVSFRKEFDNAGLAFYGPKLPLEPGEYELAADLKSPAAAGTELGTWIYSYADGPEILQAPAVAGSQGPTQFTIDKNLPFMAVFSYNGARDVEIGDVTIRRIR